MKRLSSSDSLIGVGGSNSLLIPVRFPSEDEKVMYGKEGFRSILEGLDDDCDDDLCSGVCGAQSAAGGEKKRRLSADQVRALEKNFEVENKLEPERKVQLALEIGLQPRQVAVWFQNRRARWKTKQLERDYGALKTRYDSLRLDRDALLLDKESLLAEVKQLKAKLAGEESFSSVKEEDPDSKEDAAAAPDDEEEPMALICNKDGSSDSDSSAVLNSPLISSSTATITMAVGFNNNSSSLMDKGGGGFFFHQLLKVEDHHGFLGGEEEEPCSSFFSDEQPPTLSWYAGSWD